MVVNTRNVYGCLQKCNKLNTSHLVGQLLNSIHDARTHVYIKCILPLWEYSIGKPYSYFSSSFSVLFMMTNMEPSQIVSNSKLQSILKITLFCQCQVHFLSLYTNWVFEHFILENEALYEWCLFGMKYTCRYLVTEALTSHTMATVVTITAYQPRSEWVNESNSCS